MRTPSSLVSFEAAHSLTPNDVQDLLLAGEEVVYTPHIGNKWSEDMALTQLGIPQVTFNRNAAYKDTIDQPHHVRLAGRDHVIVSSAQHGVVSPYLHADGHEAGELPRDLLTMWDELKRHPARLHFESAKRATPGTYHVADEYMFLRDSIGHRLVDILDHTRKSVDLGTMHRRIEDGRIVDHHGPTTERDLASFLDLMRALTENVTGASERQVEGPIPSNDFAVASLALRAALQQRQNGNTAAELTVYTVAGPSMILYAKGLRDSISRILASAREVEPNLPNRLNVKLIPGANLTFLPHSGERNACSLLEEIVRLDVQRRELLQVISHCSSRQDGEGKDGAIREKKEVERRIDVAKKAYAAYLAHRPFFSQYDALQTGERVVMPEGIRTMTFLRMQQLFSS
jgi:hypothetical protein